MARENIKNSVLTKSNKKVVNKNSMEYNIIKERRDFDDFRRIQEESRRISNREKQLYRSGSKEINKDLQRRLSRIFRRQLGTRCSWRRNDVRLLVDKKSGNNFLVYENVDGKTFHDIFEITRTYTKNGELVDLHEISDYNNTKNYLSEDGLSGFSITNDGDLISVFNANDKRGWLRAISNIVKENVKTLDCYASSKQNLKKIYGKIFGFKTASIMEYNMEYDHDDIAKNHNKPPVAFMVNTDKEVITKYFNKDQYDDAVFYQHSFVDII